MICCSHSGHVKTLDEFLAYGPRMSLKDTGWLDKPSAPMLVINGRNDTQVPIDDLYLLLNAGDPKEAWAIRAAATWAARRSSAISGFSRP